MQKKNLRIGVIGGLGPLASASFVDTLYTIYLSQPSIQAHYFSPNVYLYSEPLTSQSTAVMSVTQTQNELLGKLSVNFKKLLNQHVDYIIICCFTAHTFLSHLSKKQQDKALSLITLVLETIQQQEGNCLLLSASSAKEANVLENHVLWQHVSEKVSFISESQQNELNAIIYAVKTNAVTQSILDTFLSFVAGFSNSRFIIGCAELHVLHKRLKASFVDQLPFDLIDPFYLVANKVFL